MSVLRPKCTKVDFGWGSAAHPAGGTTAPPGPLAVFKGTEGKGRKRGTGESRGTPAPPHQCGILLHHCVFNEVTAAQSRRQTFHTVGAYSAKLCWLVDVCSSLYSFR